MDSLTMCIYNIIITILIPIDLSYILSWVKIAYIIIYLLKECIWITIIVIHEWRRINSHYIKFIFIRLVWSNPSNSIIFIPLVN